MDDNKQYSPYHGCLVVIFFLIAVPLALWGILDGAMAYFRPYDAWINGPGARFIGFGLGSIFHMSCIICGILRQPFRAVCYRVKEFFENLPVSLGYAFECYWDDMKRANPWMCIDGKVPDGNSTNGHRGRHGVVKERYVAGIGWMHWENGEWQPGEATGRKGI